MFDVFQQPLSGKPAQDEKTAASPENEVAAPEIVNHAKTEAKKVRSRFNFVKDFLASDDDQVSSGNVIMGIAKLTTIIVFFAYSVIFRQDLPPNLLDLCKYLLGAGAVAFVAGEVKGALRGRRD